MWCANYCAKPTNHAPPLTKSLRHRPDSRYTLCSPEPQIARRQLLQPFTTLDQPGVACVEPENSRLGGAVVIAAHHQVIRTADRHGEQLTRLKFRQWQRLNQYVAAFAI